MGVESGKSPREQEPWRAACRQMWFFGLDPVSGHYRDLTKDEYLKGSK